MLALAAALMLQAAAPPHLARARDFERAPQRSDMVRYYPERAKDLGVEGRAVLECAVAENDALAKCRIRSEQPVGWGFGEAALKMSTHFRIRARRNESHLPVGGRIVIPLRFSLR